MQQLFETSNSRSDTGLDWGREQDYPHLTYKRFEFHCLELKLESRTATVSLTAQNMQSCTIWCGSACVCSLTAASEVNDTEFQHRLHFLACSKPLWSLRGVCPLFALHLTNQRPLHRPTKYFSKSPHQLGCTTAIHRWETNIGNLSSKFIRLPLACGGPGQWNTTPSRCWYTMASLDKFSRGYGPPH